MNPERVAPLNAGYDASLEVCGAFFGKHFTGTNGLIYINDRICALVA